MTRTSARLRVGSFELNLQSGELRSAAGDRVLLREQPFQVLLMLVEREGKIVTRAEIKERLWPNDTIVDFDHSINVAIGVLRRTLGDSTANPRYIETLARRGYRLVASIEWLETAPPVQVAPAESVPEPEPLGDLTGRKVLHYRVLDVLGGGGMGMVYKAEDLKLGRSVALKFLPDELAEDPIALQRLEREAQTASALNHPSICTIYDIEEHEGQRFIAMELLEGETLQQRLATSAPEAMPLDLLIELAIQVCQGLVAAHGKAIVHRDIKPANIFLTKENSAKILDFGIAKLVAGTDADAIGERPTSPQLTSQDLTRAGATVGTSGYMSPEQVRREDLDGRSDLFSLGLVLYEMATGRRAFAGKTSVDVQDAILNTTPLAPEALNRAIPRALSRVIAKALEKERSRRYQSATEMRLALEQVRGELQRGGKLRSGRWWAAGAAVLAIAAAAVWLWPRGRIALAPSDTIVIAHLTNATGDSVFDEALYTALRIALEQTPYLNVLADHKVRGSLAGIHLDPATRITPEVALQVCRQTGSRIVVAPAIADAGNQLRLELSGIDCTSGSVVDRLSKEVPNRDDIVSELGTLTVRLRKDLGEPRSSIAKYDVPLAEATSRSPEALELLTQGYRQQLNVGSHAAIPFYERAVLTDPSLAQAHAALGNAYGNQAQHALAVAASSRAYALRERLTAPARFAVESDYHSRVFGDWETACEIRARWVQSFPHDLIARNNLGYCLALLGEPDRALGESREAARLLPAPFTYQSWVLRALAADRLDEAQSTLDEASKRGFDSASLRDLQAWLAFLRNDSATMHKQWTWAADRDGVDIVIMGKAKVEASSGRFRDALRSVEATVDTDYYTIEAALMQAEVGLSPARAIHVAPNDDLDRRLRATLALARLGRLDEAKRSADVLRRDFPMNTIVQKYALPLIDASVRLRSGEPREALELLKPSLRYDLAYTAIFPPLYPAYVRGLAYLQAGDARAAEAEFQKIIRRPGLAARGVIGPLGRLQLGRAQAATGDVTAAMGSYEAFLELWHDADAGIPLYVAAKAEYEGLRYRQGAE